MNIFPTIEMMGYDAGKPAFAGSPQSAQADFLFSIAHDFNRGTNVGVTENYVWNADGTLASFPGPGYTRLLEYDEEGRLIRIRRDYGNGNVQLAYEYAYGFDGGRRWRKDYLNGVWTRYPCGVACGAGDLVEQQKPLEGGTWTTTALYLQGISLVRRNNGWHHFDPLGTAGVITNSSASIISNNLYDAFGVLRYEQGSAQAPWRWKWIQSGEEGLRISPKGQFYLPERILIPLSSSSYDSRKDCPFAEGGPYPRSMCERFSKQCSDWAKERFAACQSTGNALAWCGALGTVCFFLPVGPLKPLCGAAGGVCTIGWMT